MTAIYFDLDGTLIEYDSTFKEIYNATLRDLGVTPHSEAEYSDAALFRRRQIVRYDLCPNNEIR